MSRAYAKVHCLFGSEGLDSSGNPMVTCGSTMGQWHEGLTEKQRRFCEAYSANGGNALDAARKSGYSFPEKQATRLLDNVGIRSALEKLRLQTTKNAIATREERQAFWSKVMNDQVEDMSSRLRASELLGKSQADFIERKEISGPGGAPISIDIDLSGLDDEQLAALERLGEIASQAS
jgi:phage terminase small subunit